MALETASYISGLNASNPAATDGLAQTDDHLRLIKSTLKATFPNVTGAATPTHTQLNVLSTLTASAAELNVLDGIPATLTSTEVGYLDGVTSSIQAQLSGNVLPTGIITLWSGAAVAIPSGWLLCDGTNGTPNLRDRFVVGAGSTYAVSATGGSANAVAVAHTHTATVTDPGHKHTFIAPNGGAGYPNPASVSYNDNTEGVSAYNNTNFIATATTGITVANSTTGVSGTNANLPPYYALCYIMKS